MFKKTSSGNKNKKRKPRVFKPAEGPLSSKSLLELSLFSTFFFIFGALLLQFLLTLHTAILLKLFSFSFQYSLFSINFLTESSTGWSPNRIYLVFGSGPFVLSATGMFLLFVLRKEIISNWRIKFALTWIAFLMVNALPCGILAGVFLFDELGMAFHWFVPDLLARGVIAMVVLTILIMFSRYWQRFFFKASYTQSLINNQENQRTYIKYVFLIPWISGFIILLVFNWQFNNFYWRAYLMCLGYLMIALLDHKSRMQRKPHIWKSDKKIFASRYQMIYFAIALLLVWIVDNAVINLVN